jgi:GntR family transcriptional regulator
MSSPAVRRDQHNPMPLYHQLASRLREQIRAGRLKPGERLSSESALSQEFGVSRMTARQGIALLVAEGLLDVRHGVGTFVAEPKLTYDALHLLGFSESLAARGSTTTSDVLEQGVEEATPEVVDGLALGGDRRVVKVRRIRRADAEPLVLETSYIPAAACAGLDRLDLTGRSLYATLEQEYGLQLAGARQNFAARPASEAERECLALPEGACVLVVWGVTEERAGRPVEYFEAVYRADRFQFSVSSIRPGPRADGDAVPVRAVLT